MVSPVKCLLVKPINVMLEHLEYKPVTIPNPGTQGLQRQRRRELGEVEVREEDLLVHRWAHLVTIHLLLLGCLFDNVRYKEMH